MSVLTYVMTLVFIAVLLRSRRPPANMIAWLTIIAFAPYVGIPLFLMIGGRKMGGGKVGMGRGPYTAPIYSRVPYGATESSLSRIERVLRSAGSPEPLFNSSIEFLDSGEKAYAMLMERIHGARHSIDLATFILKRDASGSAILRELTIRASQGVRVRLLIDALGSNALIRPSMRDFRKAGGKVAFFMPLLHVPFRGRTNLRNHRKLAIFDGETSWFGGLNLATEYMGPTKLESRWVDLSVLIRGESIRQLQEVFDHDWAFAGGSPEVRSLTGDFSPSTGHQAQVVVSGPDVSGDSLYESLLEACFEARERIWIATPYFIPDESLIKSLELACRRGVEVRLLMPAHSNHFFADLSRGSYVRQLEAAGGRIHLFPKMLHAKLVVVDDSFALAGSANFDLRSLLYNYELGVFLLSQAEIAAAAAWMRQQFVLSREGFPPAGFWRGLSEGVGRIFGPLL